MPNVEVKGTIVCNDDKWIYDYFEIQATCPKDIQKALSDANGQDVTIQINSGGGDVFSGNEIYYLISTYKGKKTVDIVGFAASAATVIACAGDTVRAVPGLQYMIHNVSCGAHGDYRTMDKTSEILQNANKSISNIYRLKTGMSELQLLELMNNETWLDAAKAKEYGFVDEIIGDSSGELSKPLSLYNSTAQILSEEVKQKIRNEVKNPNGSNTDSDFLMQKNKLNLLKLKGALK